MAKPPHDPFEIISDLQHLLGDPGKDQIDILTEAIVEEGADPGSIHVAVMPNGKRYLCDGHTTWRICKGHGLRLPRIIEHEFENLEEVKVWMKRRQVARRNFTEKMVEITRRERVDRILKATANGESINGIAAKEKVSRQTVKNVRAKAKKPKRGSNNHLFPGKNKGALGDMFPSKTTECTDCDLYGTPLPSSVKDAFQDGFLQRVLQMTLDTNAALLDGPMTTLMRKKGGRYPFLKNYVVLADKLHALQQTCDEIRDEIKAAMPTGICPSCGGKRCPTCRQSGLLPLKEYEEARKHEQSPR